MGTKQEAEDALQAMADLKGKEKDDFMFMLLQQMKETATDQMDVFDKAVFDKSVDMIYAALEELTQYKARFNELNKGFLDHETGERHTGCTPYAMERLKHKLAWMESGGRVAELEKQLAEAQKA